MNLKVDMHSGVPIYMQVIDGIKHLVATGTLKPGDQLPTVRQLAQDLRVNFNTIARAYTMLDEAGIISTQQGRGTYVHDRPDERTLSQMRAEKLHALIGRAVIEAFSLGYKPAEIRAALEETLQQIDKETRH
jgi:GntR family transcriptional regulator